MKIGLVCPYNLFKGGGVQEVVLALQHELKREGHTAKIITPLPRTHDGTELEDVIFVGRSTDFKSPFHTTVQVSVSVDTDDIEAVLEREQFDVLHFHEPWVPIMSSQVLARSRSVNIATFHAKLPGTVMSKTIERVITPYTRSVMKYLHELTAVSDVAASYVRELTNEEIAIVPNGIDLSKYKPSTETKATNEKIIFYIGRLEKRKGLKYLLQAFAELSLMHPEVRLVIGGAGPDRKKLQEYVQNNGIMGVQFLGYIDEKTKLKLLANADLFCSPAIFGESFGIVLLEAMATGTVTVAGNNPGYASVLQEKGALSLVNPKDITEFARRLELLLYDDELRKMWESWAKSYVKQYDYPTVAHAYLKIYKKAYKQHAADITVQQSL